MLDTGVLINIKRLVKQADQWEFFTRLTGLVEGGHLTFPSQVVTEMSGVAYPDAPGAWIAGPVRHAVRFSNPSDQSMVEVLRVASQLVEADADPTVVADPYVVAMAHEIRNRYPECRVVVATDDQKDHLPLKIALATACDRLDIECWTAEVFILWAKDAPDGPEFEVEEPPEEDDL